jgi:hypothetical protein
VNTGNAKNDAIANGVGTAIMLLGKWKMAHDDKKAAQAASATNESSDVDADDSTQSAQLAAQAEAEQQRILNEASQILQQSNALMASNEAGAGPASPGSPPDSTAAIGALLDSGSAAPDSTSAINALLDSTDSQASSAVKTAKTVASLLGGNSEAGAQGASESALPPVPSIQTLDDQEAAETNAVGPDWSQGLANLKDQALSQIGSAVGSIDPVTALDPHLTDDDYLQKGAQAAMQSVLPEPNAAEATLGSVVQEKAIDIASDKVADTLTDSKDQLACSGQGSQVEQDGCMVFMAPTNIARGLYNYGTILVKRFGTMMTDVNTEIWGQPE